MKKENMDLNTNGTEKENISSQHSSVINVKISEVLTPITCATLINEIFKGLLYQKCQIPYPYSWLKSVVDKKRQSNNEETKKQINFTVANHFRVVSDAYDTLEKVMNAIIKEFRDNANYIKEIVFIFGTTPQCPKEVFTINFTSIAKGHSERNHANHMNKYQQKILRNIFLSQSWLDAVDASITCTNTYIFLRKSTSSGNSCSNDGSDNFFIPSKPLTLSPKLKHIKINLNYENSENINCCNNLSVFEDCSESDILLKRTQLTDSKECEKTVMWYQSKGLFKGFKDCYINHVSACELW